MPEIAFVLPVLPGMEELDSETFTDLENDRRDEYEAALRQAGITRHTVWHQQTPNGALALVYMEADDLDGVAAFGASDAPLNRWFRERMKDIHGVDISLAGPDVNLVHDIRL